MIINTRPIQYEAAMKIALNGSGHDILSHPMLSVHEVPWVEPIDDDVDALILTSQVAVSKVAKSDISRKYPVYAVGRATAAAASEAGFSEVYDGGGTAETLLSLIDKAPFSCGLYLSARTVSLDLSHVRPDRIKRRVVYEMTSANCLSRQVRNAVAAREDVIVPFYSPRSFETFESLAIHYGLESSLLTATAIVIHDRLLTRQVLSWRQVRVAQQPDASGMLEAILDVA